MKKFFFLSLTVIWLISCTQTRWKRTDNGVFIKLKKENAKDTRLIRLEVVTDKTIHITATPGKYFSDAESLCVTDDHRVVPHFDVKQVIDTLVLSTKELRVKVSLHSGEILFCDPDNMIILRERGGGGKTFAPITVEGLRGYSMSQKFESPEDEAFYGLGQHQSDEFNYKGLNESLYQYNTRVAVPFLISNRNYGILWDNYSLTRFGDPREYSEIDLFKLYEKTGAKGGLTATYFNSSDTSQVFMERKEPVIDYENLETVKNFPEGVPLDRSAVVWSGKIEPAETGLYHFKLYYAGYTKLYIDNILVVPERWRIAWNPNTFKFRLDLEKGRQYPLRLEWQPDGGVSYIGLKALSPLTPEERGLLTLSSEMGDQIDYYFIGGENFDEVISGYRSLTGKAPIMPEWALSPSPEYLNTYALVNDKAIYNGHPSGDPDKRVFPFARSGFAGLQKYSTGTWSGDIGSRWEDMKAQISAGLSFSMSGIPYWTMDIGGFSIETRYVRAKEGTEDMNEWRELNTRWFQFGSFCPLFRSHGQYPYREIYNISPGDHPAYKSMVYYDRLRYSLMPYLYSLAGLTHFNDYTIMRAMVMDFAHDRNVENIGDQYMFGPSILVAPVYRYKARLRDVYLPSSCGWYDFHTGNYFNGGQHLEADAPYERIPLFVREGSIIPVGPDIQYTSEKPADTVTLYVYCGRDCAFTLYEDEGTNYNYEKGECSTVRFSYHGDSGELTIGDRNGVFNGMLKRKTFNVIWIDKDNPVSFDRLNVPHTSVTWEGSKLTLFKKVK